jgi:hypothetical protein
MTGDMTMSPPSIANDDPRHLRALFDRATVLAQRHEVTSVFVGIAGRDGDLLVPDFIAFVESELRVEDAVFRMLRERAVLLLTDVDRNQAEAVMDRLRGSFSSRFAPSAFFEVDLGFHQVDAGRNVATAKEVLPRLFAPFLDGEVS